MVARKLGMAGEIARGYGRLLLAVLLWAAVGLACVGLAAAIVWPLWLLATGWTSLYNALFVAVLLLGLLALALASFRRRLASGERAAAVLAAWGRGAATALAVPALLVSLWISVLLLLRPAAAGPASLPSLALGAGAGLVALALAGWLFFGRKGR